MNRKAKAAEFLDQAYNISVSGRHVQISQAMKDYAIEKVSKIERFSSRIIDVLITMDIQKLDHRVDIVLRIGHMKIRSQASTTDMYISIDMAVHKLEIQLLRYKAKIQEHQTRDLTSVDMNVNVYRPSRYDELAEVNSEIEEENERQILDKYQPHEIVCREKLPLKILNHEEAIIKMELSGDPFMIFRNEEDHKLQVIYRRADRNFGVINPEG